MNRQALLLISRRDLIEASDSAGGDKVITALAALTRTKFHFVATASQPDEWSKNKAVSKRSKPGPRRIRDRLAEAGGGLDGVYYIPQSLLTQRTRRDEALRDILERFALAPSSCHLLSSNRKLLSSADSLGINTWKINEKNDLYGHLSTLDKMVS